MDKVVLIPAQTPEWYEAGRLHGRLELSPTLRCTQRAHAWTSELHAADIGKIFHAPDDLSRDIARLTATRLDVPTKLDTGLREIDLGLWAGLTEDELKTRYHKTYRQLHDAPLSVEPPEGEDLADAAKRISGALQKRLKKNGTSTIGLVLRPFALGVARCLLGESEWPDLWLAQRVADPLVIERSAELERAAAV